MTSNKKFNQQLKRPDSFQVKALGYLQWAEQHRVKVMGALGAVAIVCAGYFTFQYMQGKRTEQRRAELATIDFRFNEEAEAAGKQQAELHGKLTEVEKKIEEITKDPSKAQNGTTLASLQAEKKSLETKMENIKPQHDASREQYLAYFKNHKSTPEGWRAAMQIVTVAIEQEKYAEASELLKELLPLAKGSYFYDMQVRSTYISLLEEQGQYDQALAETEELIKIADEGMMPRALLIKGRLLLLAERKAEAKEVFKKIIAEHNSSFEAGKAKAYNLL